MDSTEPLEEPVMPRMVERTGFDDGQYLGGYYVLRFYARADRVSGSMSYEKASKLGILLDVRTGTPYVGWYYEHYYETTYSIDSHDHTHMWDAGRYLAVDASASYSINGGTVGSLGGNDLQ